MRPKVFVLYKLTKNNQISFDSGSFFPKLFQKCSYNAEVHHDYTYLILLFRLHFDNL